MKKLCLFLLLQICFSTSFSQYLKKYDIGNSGCSVYLYCNPGDYQLSYSEDSSEVYTSECINDSTHYGVICVKLKESVSDMTTAENLLISYMDFLKTSFKITSAVGYGKGSHLADREDIRGIVDYWTDNENNNWKVHGWTDGNFIGILYGYSSGDLPESKVNVFLESFRLPGM